jgi:hypothetical protein
MKRATERSEIPEHAPILPTIDAADDEWALGATSSLHLALAEAKSAYFCEKTAPATPAPAARLDNKPIIMATDQDILPPALHLSSISDSTSKWADDLTSMLRVFNNTLMDLNIVEHAPIPAPMVETPGVISDDDLSECDSSASDNSFDSLFDSSTRLASPHTDQSTFISNSSSLLLASAKHSAALVLFSEAFTLVPCTLEPRSGDISGRKVSGFVTFPNLNYQKPENIDDDNSEAWNSDDVLGVSLVGFGEDGVLDKAEDDEKVCAVYERSLELYDENAAGSFSALDAGQLDQQQEKEKDIPILELFEQRRLDDSECPATNGVENAPCLHLTMGERKDEITTTRVEKIDELDAVFELEWAKYEAEYDTDADTLAKTDTWDTSKRWLPSPC